MTTIPQVLPVEIIEEIAQIAALVQPSDGRERRENLCKMRFVSRQFSAVVSPVLFTTLHLEWSDADRYDNPPLNCFRCQEIITSLASGSTRVFEHTRVLSFRTEKLYRADKRKGIKDMRKNVEENLFRAVTALKNLQTINWLYNPKFDPQTLAADLIHALGTLQSFEGFNYLCFRQPPEPSFSLQPLSNLRVFKNSFVWNIPDEYISEVASLLTRCPDIKNLELFSDGLDGGDMHDFFAELNKSDKSLQLTKLSFYGATVTPEGISANLRHLQHLEFLEIFENDDLIGDGSRFIYGKICTILKQNGIFLTGVSTDFICDPLLFDYLTSYSGLQKLRLEGRHALDENAELVNKVYQTVLPKHRDTLQSLALGSLSGGIWSSLPTNAQLARIVECQKLRKLKFYYDSEPGSTKKDIDVTLNKYLETAMKLPELTHLRMYAAGCLPKGIATYAKDLIEKFKKEKKVKFSINDERFGWAD